VSTSPRARVPQDLPGSRVSRAILAEADGIDLQRNAVGVRSVRPRDHRPDHYTFSHFSGPVRMLFKWPGVHPREALIRDQPVDVVNGDPRVDKDRWRDTQVVRAPPYQDGNLRIGYRFPTRAEAVAWAEAERAEHETGGPERPPAH